MPAKRILFVDNRPEHVRQPVLRLQVEGYEVDAADSGRRGWPGWASVGTTC